MDQNNQKDLQTIPSLKKDQTKEIGRKVGTKRQRVYVNYRDVPRLIIDFAIILYHVFRAALLYFRMRLWVNFARNFRRKKERIMVVKTIFADIEYIVKEYAMIP